MATGLTPAPLPADDDEFIERRVVPLTEAVRMAVEGEITEAVSKVALLQYGYSSMSSPRARRPV